MSILPQSAVEQATLAWYEGISYVVRGGNEYAPPDLPTSARHQELRE